MLFAAALIGWMSAALSSMPCSAPATAAMCLACTLSSLQFSKKQRAHALVLRWNAIGKVVLIQGYTAKAKTQS